MENLVFLATEHASHQGWNLGNIAVNLVSFFILLVLLKKFAWDKLVNLMMLLRIKKNHLFYLKKIKKN